MGRVPVPREQPEVQRQEGETDALVLANVAKLVPEERGAERHRRNDDVAEGDRDVATAREEAVGQATIAHIAEAAAAKAGPGEREQSDEVADRVGVVPDQRRISLIRSLGQAGDDPIDRQDDGRLGGGARVVVNDEPMLERACLDGSDALEAPHSRYHL